MPPGAWTRSCSDLFDTKADVAQIAECERSCAGRVIVIERAWSSDERRQRGVVRRSVMIELPAGCELVRTTREFDEHTVPAGLLAAHRVAEGLWGRLVVRDGSVGFGFDDGNERTVSVGESQVIPPGRLHHLSIDGAVRFVVEFHRPSDVGEVAP